MAKTERMVAKPFPEISGSLVEKTTSLNGKVLQRIANDALIEVSVFHRSMEIRMPQCFFDNESRCARHTELAAGGMSQMVT